jgi:alpha-galactosidase
MPRRLVALSLLISSLAGCADDEPPASSAATPPASSGPQQLGTGTLLLTARPAEGSFDVGRGTSAIFERATADVLVGGEGGDRLLSLLDAADRHEEKGAIVGEIGGLGLALTLTSAGGGAYLAARLDVTNHGTTTVQLKRLAPLVVDTARGGLIRLGQSAATHRILENGRYALFDQTAQLEAGDVKPFALGQGLPIPLRGNSVSNWNHVVADLADPSRSLVAGFLSFERSIPTIGIGAADESIAGFSIYAAENALIFHGKPLAPGATLRSETFYLDPLPPDPVEGLERYAAAVAAFQKITPWTQRGPGHEVPNGWNSWTGGSSTGGYGQDIDAPLITQNLAAFAGELLPFGDTYFQIDDGWQKATGDWEFKDTTFPAGGAALAQQIAATGLKPGLWLAPFWVAPGSQLSQDHPGWLMPAEGGVAAVLAKDKQALDLSNPEVIDHLHALMTGLRNDGWRWIKGDFTYQAAAGQPVFDPTLTNIESFRAGWRAIREALGPDIFLLGIGIVGANIGVVDGMRLTLDNGPKWEEASADALADSPRAFKGTVRTGSRRWFYQNRIWENHDDLIFFRPDPDPEVPPLTLAESRSFASWVSLGGGTVELGDKVLDFAMKPGEVDVLRRLVPVYPEAARPIDVLTRDYPEVHVQRVAAAAGEWRNVGLFNWGKNRDWSVNPPAAMPDESRQLTVPCEGECLAFEFWSQTFLGQKSGPFSIEVEPHGCRVIALRAPTGHPQLLGHNRHLTQGAVDAGEITWNEASRTLSGTLLGAAGTAAVPFTHEASFYAPAGYQLKDATVDGATDLSSMQEGEVVRIQFRVPTSKSGQMMSFAITF